MMKDFIFYQQQQQQQEENMSNLTSASGEASVSSSGNRHETTATNFSQQQYFALPPQSQPAKKKRNLPGNPDPDAEVIALSPKSLLATNRFVCEICNKGFQRDQNLQLHRRGHNLPWKLKQRANKDVIRKKVYVCPEVSCVHHDPSRALGDLTGVKKHFCRKHGEKKWKCDKCSKRYAVQSDWKAHSKTCGTREYRCDCGTLFSRRDSFITHRAFCDALAEESARAISGPLPNPILSSAAAAVSSTTHNINLQIPQFNIRQTHQDLNAFSLKKEQESFSNLRPELPPWLACPPPAGGVLLGSGPPIDHHHLLLSSSSSSSSSILTSNPNPSIGGPTLPHQYQAVPSPHMSATALLQKAAQMGSTMSGAKTTSFIRPHQDQAHVSPDTSGDQSNTTNAASFALNVSSRDQQLPPEEGSFIHGILGSTPAAGATGGAFLQEMMNSLSSASGFEDAFVGGVLNDSNNKGGNFELNNDNGGGGGGGGEGLTRDFLGLRAFSHSDILSIAGLGNCVNTSHEQLNQSQKTWRG